MESCSSNCGRQRAAGLRTPTVCRRAGIAGHPHSQPNPRYRCFLPDLTEFTRFVIERDPAIAVLDKAISTLLVSSEGVNCVPGPR